MAAASPPLLAQPATTAPAPVDAETFLRLARSNAVVQARAAELAASRDTRAEVKAFAERMIAFRRSQLPKLEAAAQASGIAVQAVPELEHRVILENLEPLDYLALSRRYAEFQVQALEQEQQIYAASASGSAPGIAALAREMAPELQTLLADARKVLDAVGP